MTTNNGLVVLDSPAAVLYLRCSNPSQEESVQSQRERIYPYFQGKYRIIREYVDEGLSGSHSVEKRKDFLRMVRDLTTGCYSSGKDKVQVVLCLDLSRFGRLDTLKGAVHKDALREAGVILDTVIDGSLDWTTTTGRIIDSVRSEGNHDLSLKIGEKGLQGRIRVTKEGKPNQTTPYGMAKLVTSTTGEQHLIKRGQRFSKPKTWGSVFVPGDEREVAGIKFLFKTYDERDLSYNEIARMLHDEGYPPPTTVGWQGQIIPCMLTNPVYAGDLIIGAKPKGKFFRAQNGQVKAKKTVTAPSPTQVANTHTALIPRPLFDRVQAKIAKRLKKRPVRNKGAYALSGVIHCGNCGQPMYGAKNEHGVVIYRCHRVELGYSTCGYWIAYERDILPFLLQDFLADIRKQVEAEAQKLAAAAFTPKSNTLSADLAALERKLALARERFLEAPPELAKGLMETLAKWEAEKQALLNDQSAQVEKDEPAVSRWWKRFLSEFLVDRPAHVDWAQPFSENGQAGFQVEIPVDNPNDVSVNMLVPASLLREKLKRIDCKVSVWFVPKTKGKGYNLDKVRVQAFIDGDVCYEYSGSVENAQDTCIEIDLWYSGAAVVKRTSGAWRQTRQ